ncbi:hypothetical protein SAY87_031273 [Trapa incisa]|uniref:Seipin n=1 Tax=Trapa incisa TaxID=236973 RepID=A0AAN7KP13_9MYRT|nr:hypothetical protein SAY87_031273 [Trapa incisa]
MDSSAIRSEADGPFYDASDDFPFYDCVDFDQSEQPYPVSSATLRRRRPSRDSKPNDAHVNRLDRYRDRGGSDRVPPFESNDKPDDSSTTTIANGERIRDSLESSSSVRAASPGAQTREGSAITEVDDGPAGDSVDSVIAPGDRESQPSSLLISMTHEHSAITEVDDGPAGDSVDSVIVPSDREAPPSSFLISMVEFLIKAISFQFYLLIKMLKFPFWCLYTSLVFIMDPLSSLRHSRHYIAGKLSSLWNLMWKCASPFICQWLKEHESIWMLMMRFGWGLFWAIYVCFILFGLLITATLLTVFMMRFLVKEPTRIEEKLKFDYTKHHPVAYVPVVSCGGVDSGAKFKELAQLRSSQQSRVILPNQKLQATVRLTLPESDYNKNLGIFQIRVDFLSANGETLASSTHPCMLLFKSEPLHLVLTVLKIAPLIAGYISESQTISVKFQGFTEGHMPTSCLRVLIEQRAEYHPGAGIPEIYDATVILESELPLLRRLLWYWRKTFFIWTVMVSFTVELLFLLICCRPVILPITKRRSNSTGIRASNA